MSELFKRATKYLGSHRGLDIPSQELKEVEQKVASRRKAGRYTLEEAAMYIADKGKTAPVRMLNRLIEAKAHPVDPQDKTALKTYRPDDKGIHTLTMLVRQWSDEVYWNEINDWLVINEPVIGRIFPNPDSSATNTQIDAGKITSDTPVTQVNKLRRDILDPVIDKAIKQAGNMEPADVYLKLKELALANEPPFSGAIDGNALCYTDTNDAPARLTKNALEQRLKRRVKLPTTN